MRQEAYALMGVTNSEDFAMEVERRVECYLNKTDKLKARLMIYFGLFGKTYEIGEWCFDLRLLV